MYLSRNVEPGSSPSWPMMTPAGLEAYRRELLAILGDVAAVEGAVADHAELRATIARIRDAITITTDLDHPDGASGLAP